MKQISLFIIQAVYKIKYIESQYSPKYVSFVQDPILTQVLLIREYALACLGPCTAHSQFSYLFAWR